MRLELKKCAKQFEKAQYHEIVKNAQKKENSLELKMLVEIDFSCPQ